MPGHFGPLSLHQALHHSPRATLRMRRPALTTYRRNCAGVLDCWVACDQVMLRRQCRCGIILLRLRLVLQHDARRFSKLACM